MLSIEQSSDKISRARDLALASGILSKDLKTGQFRPVRLALNAFKCKKENKRTMEEAHKIWQKLVLIACRDHEYMNKLYGGKISENDEMIGNWLNIYN